MGHHRRNLEACSAKPSISFNKASRHHLQIMQCCRDSRLVHACTEHTPPLPPEFIRKALGSLTLCHIRSCSAPQPDPISPPMAELVEGLLPALLTVRVRKASGELLELPMGSGDTVKDLKAKLAELRKSTRNRHRVIFEDKDPGLVKRWDEDQRRRIFFASI